jgi:hypothetical protein
VTTLNEPQSPSLRSWTPGYGQDSFPGIENSFAGPPAVINPTVLPAQITNSAKSGLPFSLTNLNDLKSIVDRMGGIEGVLTTMGKFQKFMSTVQQFAPMLKLFMGSKGSKADSTNNSKGSPRRRRTAGRPTTGKARKTQRPTKRR